MLDGAALATPVPTIPAPVASATPAIPVAQAFLIFVVIWISPYSWGGRGIFFLCLRTQQEYTLSIAFLLVFWNALVTFDLGVCAMLADFLSSIIPALRPIFDSLAESGNGLDYR
jgi:hypothetical protein